MYELQYQNGFHSTTNMNISYRIFWLNSPHRDLRPRISSKITITTEGKNQIQHHGIKSGGTKYTHPDQKTNQKLPVHNK